MTASEDIFQHSLDQKCEPEMQINQMALKAELCSK